jgi:gluconolactonase
MIKRNSVNSYLSSAKNTFLSFSLMAICGSAFAQTAPAEIGTVEFVSPELSSVIKKTAKVESIAQGFQFTEGPVWVEKSKMLLFSDVPGNTIYKWTAEKGKEIYVKPAGYTGAAARSGFVGSNGLVITPDGKLLICQHGDRRVARMDAGLEAPESKFVTVADRLNGKRLNSPNDLVLHPNGDMYLTDPSYGLSGNGKGPDRETPYQGVYKIKKSGEVELLVDSIEQPNGIAFFPGRKTMLISNSDNAKKRWYVYDVTTDGRLANGKVFYDVSSERGAGGCDGLKIDKNGNVFATGPGGIWIFSKAGKLMGKIKVNGQVAANCAFSPDEKTLYITASTQLLRLKMR